MTVGSTTSDSAIAAVLVSRWDQYARVYQPSDDGRKVLMLYVRSTGGMINTRV